MTLHFKQFIDRYLGGLVLWMNLLPVRLLGIVMQRNHSIAKAPQHILVIKMLGLGSLLLASDSIYSLRKKYPGAKFILLCGRQVKPGIDPLGLFDEIRVLDDRNFFAMAASGIRHLVHAWKLKGLWVLDLEVYSILTTIFSTWTCAINRFGFQLDKVNFRNYLNTHNTYFNQFITVDENYHALVQSMGVEAISTFTFPGFSGRTLHSESCKRYIAVNNTCSDLGGHLRKIPEPILAGMCRHILHTTPYHVAFTGAPTDHDALQQFIETHFTGEPRIANFAGKLSFEGYYRFLYEECAWMISIDSAPFHIATKLGLPTISLWGPVGPLQRFAVQDPDRKKYYYLGKACSPCIHHTEVIPCGGDNTCMTHMDPAYIGQLIDQMAGYLKANSA